VASVDTELDPSRYRRYRLKTVTQNDDFASMHEILGRRLRRGLVGATCRPHRHRWGKGQLAAAQAAMKDSGVEGVDLVSLAKSTISSGRPRSLIQAEPGARLPLGSQGPIVLSQTSPELFALTRLRDEAHRFAITYQRKLSRRRGLSSELDRIPGVGEARRTALLAHFGSVTRMREASIEEIAEVEGLGPAVAERIHAFLHQPKTVALDVDEDTVREVSLEDAGDRPEPTTI